MIVLYDHVQSHVSHASFTCAFTQVVAEACPGRRIVVRARPSHLRAAFAETSAILDGRLTQEIIPENEPGPTVGQTLRFLRDAWRASKPPKMVIFLSARPAEIWAAKLFRRWCDAFRCHLVLHGDVGSIRQPRSRNPARRIADFAGSMAWVNHPDVRFLALEKHISTNLAAALPAVGPFVDAIHHPYLPDDAPFTWHSPPPEGRLRFGLLGIAGRSKGLDVFARVARRMMSEAPKAADFRLVGKVQRGWQDLDLSGISGPRPFSEDWLPRPVLERELANLDYLILPYNMDYYALSASGVLLDALRWRKPVIAFKMPALVEIGERFGDIGHICTDEDAMVATVRRLIGSFDPERYQAQRRNLDAAHRTRLPESVAHEYVDVLHSRWAEDFAYADDRTVAV